MKSTVSIVIFLFILSLVSAQEEMLTTRLSTFTKLKVFDGISVTLIKSKEDKAVISGANTQKVALVTKDGVLKIRMEIEKIFSGYRTFIDLYHTEDLVVLDVNEDALIASSGTITQNVLELKAQEGGEINIDCQTEQLLVKAITGGDISTIGFTNNQDIRINTGGRYNGKQFKSSFTTIAVNAGGSAEIYATKYVKAEVKAGGNVNVYGDPEKMDEKTVLGGSIERMD